jgi:hypothetical protein
MKLTYWYSRNPNDSDCYSIRETTKREAQNKVDKHNAETPEWGDKWEPAKKVSVDYRDAFQLMTQCTQEDHHHWEA